MSKQKLNKDKMLICSIKVKHNAWHKRTVKDDVTRVLNAF